ncbi:substrate-binding domain-containing protein [Verrucomicrobiota bacterium]
MSVPTALEPKLLDRIPCPFVLVPRLAPVEGYLAVGPDAAMAGELAAEHFLSLHLTDCAVHQTRNAPPHNLLASSFCASIERADGRVIDAPIIGEPDKRTSVTFDKWIQSLPCPCGVLCDQDTAARPLVAVISEHGLRVPEDVAVLGLGDDQLHSLLTVPPLSTVDLPAEEIGRRAAELLISRLKGRSTASAVVAPTGITARESTDTLAIKDPVVARSVRFIRTHFGEPINAVTVARRIGVARTTLQTRFQKVMGLSIHDEVIRCRLGKALKMLSDPAEPIKRVASDIGMPGLSNFNRFIKRHTGLSPREYRARIRIG